LRDKKPILFLFAIVLVCTFLYIGSLNYPFVNWDDYNLITFNRHITELNWSNIRDIFSPGVVGAYQPIRTLSYAMDYRIWGLNSLGYHISNFILYLLTCILTYFFILYFLRDHWLALCGGLFFAVHPLHVEAVTWLSARKETLSGVFFLASFLFYARSTKSGVKFYWASILCFVLALLSKPTVVILPGLIVLYDLCFVIKGDLRNLLRRIKFYLPYVALSGGLTYITILLSSRAGVLKGFHGGTVYSQILTSLTVFVKNIRLMVMPTNLSPRYTDYYYDSLRNIEALLAVMCVAMLIYVAWEMWRRSKLVFFAMLWYPVTILPVSNLVPISTLMADRYLFLPSIGIALLFAIIVGKLVTAARTVRFGRFLRPAVLAACLLLLSFYSAQTVQRNGIWKDSESLWSDAVRQDSTNVLAYFALGNVKMEAGKAEEAIEHYRTAISLAPNFSTVHAVLANAYLLTEEIDRAIFHYKEALRRGSEEDLAIYANLGMAFESKGLFDQAIEQYETALGVDSTYAMARLGLAMSYSGNAQYDRAIDAYNELIKSTEEGLRAQVYFNLGVAQHQKGLYDEARDSYTEALKIDSTFAQAHYGLGNTFYMRGDTERAMAAFEDAIKLFPGHVASLCNLGNCYSDRGDYREAIKKYEEAMDVAPVNQTVRNNLGLMYTEAGDLDKAVETFLKLLDSGTENPNIFINLGYVHMKQGKLDEAHAQYRKAIELDPKNADAFYNMACAYALQGNNGPAVFNLGKALELGFDDWDLIRDDEDLDGIRGEAGFPEANGHD